MFELFLISALLLLVACVAWVVSISLYAVSHILKPWRYSVRDLLVFLTVVALTAAMASSLIGS